MAEQSRRKGNPNWIKGGPSPNPLGRPRAGLAFAERGRERIDPDKVLDLAVRVLEDEKLAPKERLAIVMPVVDRIYVKPPTQTQLEVSAGAAPDLSHVSDERLEAMLRELECGAGDSPASMPAIPESCDDGCKEQTP